VVVKYICIGLWCCGFLGFLLPMMGIPSLPGGERSYVILTAVACPLVWIWSVSTLFIRQSNWLSITMGALGSAGIAFVTPAFGRTLEVWPGFQAHSIDAIAIALHVMVFSTLLLPIAATLWQSLRVRRAASADSEPRCPQCGYLLYGLPVARCPECGSRFRVISYQPPRVEPLDEPDYRSPPE
jgi:hypothetical protein